MKAQGRKTAGSKRRKPAGVARRGAAADTNAAHLERELAEAHEQQQATADVLRVIASSPGDIKSVFTAMLANATRLCRAKFGTLYLREVDGFRIVAMHGAPLAFVKERQRNPMIRPGASTVLGRAIARKRATQIADIKRSEERRVGKECRL